MKKIKKTSPALRKLLTGGLLLCACLMVAFLSFISLDLALIGGVVVTLAAFFDLTRAQSQNLEHFLQTSIHDMQERQKTLENNVISYREEVRKMEQELTQTKTILAAPLPFREPETKTGFSFNEIIPAFLRPHKNVPTPQKITEEDEDDDIILSPPATRTAPVVETRAIANDEILLDDQSLSDMVVRELIHHAVRHNRIDVFVQPILRLPQRQVKFHEMFARIRAKAGVYLPAKRYMDLASEENVMNTIDTMLLLHGLQALRKNRELQRVSSFFLNITPKILRDRQFMQTLLDFLGQNRDLASCLIFEMRQSDFETLNIGERQILRGLAQLGCALSLDHIDQIPQDIKFLQDNKIRFVKIGAEKLLMAAKSDRTFTEMVRHKRVLESNGIGVIVEKIESETDLLELLDFNINYGQGFLFGKPDLQGVYARTRRVS